MTLVFELGGALAPSETAHNLMRLIAEGPSGDEAQDEEFRWGPMEREAHR